MRLYSPFPVSISGQNDGVNEDKLNSTASTWDGYSLVCDCECLRNVFELIYIIMIIIML